MSDLPQIAFEIAAENFQTDDKLRQAVEKLRRVSCWHFGKSGVPLAEAEERTEAIIARVIDEAIALRGGFDPNARN